MSVILAFILLIIGLLIAILCGMVTMLLVEKIQRFLWRYW